MRWIRASDDFSLCLFSRSCNTLLHFRIVIIQLNLICKIRRYMIIDEEVTHLKVGRFFSTSLITLLPLLYCVKLLLPAKKHELYGNTYLLLRDISISFWSQWHLQLTIQILFIDIGTSLIDVVTDFAQVGRFFKTQLILVVNNWK